MKILTKLILGFLTVAALCGTVGVVGLRRLGSLTRSLQTISGPTLETLDTLQSIYAQLLRIKVATRSIAHPQGLRDPEYLRAQREEIATARRVYGELIERYEALPKIAEEARRWDDIKTLLPTVRDYNDSIVTTATEAAASPEAMQAAEGRLFQLVAGEERLVMDNLLAKVDELIKFNQEYYAGEVPRRAIAEAEQYSTVLLSVTIAAILAALVLGIILGRAISGSLRKAVATLDRIAVGDTSLRFTAATKDEFSQVARSLGTVADTLEALISETGRLTKEAKAGKLDTRGAGEKFHGGYRGIVEGVNDTLEAVVRPINEVLAKLNRMAEGDLTVSMTGDYQGDFGTLKNALNETLGGMNGILGQVAMAVEQVSSGSEQVSQASQALSQGATEQASSLEEITSSVTEIAGQTRRNTENAVRMNALAGEAKENAGAGDRQMKELVIAMGDINRSAQEIGKIVKAIDDISFQINLLSLNANVEAARAGKYGKGFAVVAEEVRNLAVRSAGSVKETTAMVEVAIGNIERGNSLVNVTAKQLAAIAEGSSQVASLAEEVATAGREQSRGLEQITAGLNQIDQVTQSNTASAEESASASEELSGQARQLKEMVGRFKLKEKDRREEGTLATLRAELARLEARISAQGGAQNTPRALALRREDTAVGAGSSTVVPGIGAKPGSAKRLVNPAEVINLDDDDFGKF